MHHGSVWNEGTRESRLYHFLAAREPNEFSTLELMQILTMPSPSTYVSSVNIQFKDKGMPPPIQSRQIKRQIWLYKYVGRGHKAPTQFQVSTKVPEQLTLACAG